MDEGEIAARIRAAIRSLILDQWELAALDVGERTVTSHLFRHLADQFHGTGFDVDHEYNRRCDLTKLLTFRRGDELGERRIFPDLIVHRRNRDGFNLVAMEAKKGPETDSDDREKMHALLSQREYKYQCGVLAVTRRLRLVTSTRCPGRSGHRVTSSEVGKVLSHM